MRLNPYLLILGLLCCQYISHAQTVSPGTVSNSVADQKGGTSVDYATGVMHYSIPLFEVSQDEYKLPFALTYSASGVKVDQQPGISGLGWGLTYGAGIITRTMKGSSADEDFFGYLNNPVPSSSTPAYIDLKKQVNTNKIDGESDIFQLNIGGSSVRFILRKVSGNIIVEPLVRTDITITCGYNPSSSKIDSWTVKDPQGNVYEFVASYPGNAFIVNPVPTNSYSKNIITSWYLKSVQLVNEGKIDFIYNEQQYAESFTTYPATYNYYGVPLSLPILGSDPSLNAALQSLNASNVANAGRITQLQQELFKQSQNREKALKSLSPSAQQEISTSYKMINGIDLQLYNLQIQFTQSQINDVQWATDNTTNQIQNILYQMYNNNYSLQSEIKGGGQSNILFNMLIKRIALRNAVVEFEYAPLANFEKAYYLYSKISYRSIGGDLIKSIYFTYTPKGSLKKVQVVSADKSIEREYTFEYYNEDAQLDATSKDYWGYYNGKANSSLFPDDPMYMVSDASNPGGIPVFNFSVVPSDYASKITSQYGGVADRRPDATKAIARTLKQVTTSMGDVTGFEYETNTITPHPGLSSNIEIGGLRIKKITRDPGFGTPITKTYKYDFGRPGSPSTIVSTGRLTEWYTKCFAYEYRYDSYSPHDITVYTDPVDLGTAVEDNSNNGVLYHYVEEISDDNSAVGYKYAAIRNLSNRGEYESLFDNALIAQISYDASGKIVHIQRNGYITNGDLRSRSDETNLFAYNYFTTYTGTSAGSLTQVTKEPVFYDAASLSGQFSNGNSYITNFGPYQYSLNPYLRIFIPNYLPRCKSTYFTDDYTLATSKVLLLREQQQFTFGDYNTATAYAATNAPSLPDEKAYLYERLLAASNIPVNKTATIFSYENAAHMMPTKVQTKDSKGNISIVRTKYAADYQLPSTATIAKMQQQHIKNAIIEKQSWISKNQGTNYELLNGERFDYVEVIANGRSNFLQDKRMVLQKTASFSPSTYGFSESVTTLPPYTSSAWENNTLYRLSHTLKWTAYNDFMRTTGVFDRAGRAMDVKLFDKLRGLLLLESNYIDPENAVAADFSAYQEHPYYKDYNLFKAPSHALETYPEKSFSQKPFTTSSFTNIFTMNHMAYVAGIIQHLENFQANNPTQWATANSIPFFQTMTTFFYKVKDRIPANEFYQEIFNLQRAHQQLSGPDFMTLYQYDQIGILYYLEMEMYMSSLFNTLFADQSGKKDYTNYEAVMLADQKPILPVDATSIITYKVKVSDLVAAGKNLDVYVANNPFAPISGMLHYNGGTPSSLYTVTGFNNASDKVRKATIPLSSLPSSSQLKEIEFRFNYFQGSFAAVPSNSIFRAYAYLPDGKPYFMYDQTGEYSSIFYNQLGQPSFTKDHRGNVLSVDSVALSQSGSRKTDMVKLEIRNNYDMFSTSPPNIVGVHFHIQSTQWIMEVDRVITPGQIYRTEIPAGTYVLTIGTTSPVGQILFNNTPFTSNNSVTISPGTSTVTISVNP